MSFNQSKAEKSEGQLRRPGRSGSFGQHRGFSGGGKGGVAAPPPQSSSNPASLSSNRSSQKSGNVQGGYSRVNPSNAGPVAGAAVPSNAVNQAFHNGAHVQAPSQGSLDALAPSGAKPVEVSRSSRALPKPPSSQSAAVASDSVASATPAKGNGSKQFTLQFGTISPGIMNGMQIPARTSSAPPNLDEQKRDQARHDSFRAVPTLPLPAAPRQHQEARKDGVGAKQSGPGHSHPQTQIKLDVHSQIPPSSSMALQNSSILPVAGMPIHMPFQQTQITFQFGGPDLQLQSQGLAANSLQTPLTLPVGSAPQVPQQMFIPGLHSHPIQPQGLMHQGQALGFAPQMGHQLPPQLGNMGIPIGQQFAQQQSGKFGGQRKTVKITHPETHEELRLDRKTDSYIDGGSSVQRSLPNLAPQSQPLPTLTPHQINYYPPLQHNSYGPPSMFYPAATSVPPSSNQMTSQAPKHSFSMGQSGQSISFPNPALNLVSGSKTGPPLHAVPESVKLEASSLPSRSSSVQVSIKPSVISNVDRIRKPSVTIAAPARNSEAPKFMKQTSEVTATPQTRDNENSLESSVQLPHHFPEAGSALSVTDKPSTPPALSLQGTKPPAGVPEAAAATKTEGTKGPVCESYSSEEQPMKPDMPNAFGVTGQSSSMTMKDSRSADAVLPTEDSHATDVASQAETGVSDNSQAFSLADTSTSGLPLSSPCAEHPMVSEVGTSESVKDEPMLKLVASVSSSNDLELQMAGVPIEENCAAQATTFLAPDADETTSNKLDTNLPQSDHSLADVAQKPLMREERSEESNAQVQDNNCAKVYPISIIGECSGSVETGTLVKQEDVTGAEDSDKAIVPQSPSAEDQQLGTCMGEVNPLLEVDQKSEMLDGSSSTSSGLTCGESDSSPHSQFVHAEVDKLPPEGTLINEPEVVGCQDVGPSNSSVHPLEYTSSQASVSSETGQKLRGKITDQPSENPLSAALSGPKDKPSLESARAKTISIKKKRREILHKADLPGSSDLYNAYKGPEEKLETASTLESTNSSSSVDMKDASVNDLNPEAVVNEDDGPSKSEVDDWEDAADISTPKLRTSEISNQVDGARKQHDKYVNENTGKKKYSKDFLLTFSEQCTQLPVGFEIGSDIVTAVMSGPVLSCYVVDHEPHPSPGRSMDRSSGGPRVDRRAVGIVDDDRWAKSPGSFGPGQDVRHDIGHGAAAMNLRPGQGITHGVLRNPRGLPPGQYVGGILTGPLQPMPMPGGVRNGVDADRWQRATNFQRGVPQTPTQVMHKAVKKYEVGKVSDEEEAKQRQLKGILNKLTPQNFEKLFAQVKAVNIDNTVTLKGVISQIFDKALTEPTFCEMYASFCSHLAADLPDFIEDNEKVTFKRLLLNKCQEEFERGEREQAEADKAAEEGEIEQSEEEREEKRIKARRRMLGNIRLIGELYKKKMLTERIMHECIQKLLGQYQNPDEEDIEALCKLMSTIGEMIDHAKAKEHMDSYFDRILKLSTNQKLSSRVRFMLKDAIDLRKNKWQQRRKVEGPKKIEEVHRDAAFERQAQASRSARGPVITSSPRRGAPADYGPRGASGLSAASQQMSGSRGFPSQSRAYGIQDVRSEGRQLYDSRTLSVPLPQRPTDDDSITLGPQGGLARGMSIRGQPLVSNAPPLAETPSGGENRRTTLGPNGYHSTPYSSREEVAFRNLPDRMVGTSYDKPTRQDHNTYSGSRDSMTVDRSFERPTSFAPAGRVQGSTITSGTVPSEAKPLSEEDLRDKSISAIKEYYSAKDEEEVAWCIKELNSPSFYPTMISVWVTDSFERKNMERECLAKLLVNLCKSRERLLGQSQLIQGFQFVLMTLEDAVNDAPKAAEFLGQLFAKVILENVVPFADIGRLIHEGGEEPGQLIEIGLASEVLGSTLEFIKLEKGDSVLNEIRANSNLRLEDFRPPHPMKAKKLDAFLQM